ncbi:MAG: hypothetical protein ABJB98_02010 [Actinomycetota bacterium]
MTDQALRRADQLLSELIELVETARTVPMSASCVVPREHVLDLLDELREVMPPEMDEARRLIAQRDSLLRNADESAADTRARSQAEAETILADAQHHAQELRHSAEARAHEIVESGRAEHGQLVSASGVHRAANESAAQQRAEAEHYDAQVRGEADRYALALRADAEGYVDRTLADLVAILHRATAAAEQGRQALARRRGDADS